MHNVMARMYRHCFAGGTFDQLHVDGDVIIIVLNPAVTKGTIKRKSYGTLYDRNVVYLNTVTGHIEMRTPGDWGQLDPAEVRDKLDAMEAEKLV